MNKLPTHVTIKLYRAAYQALYDEMKLLEAYEVERFNSSTSAAHYFWSEDNGYHLRCLYAGLIGHNWKRPDDLVQRPGKPACVKFSFAVALTLYGHLRTLRKTPQHPIQAVIDALDKALIDIGPRLDGPTRWFGPIPQESTITILPPLPDPKLLRA